MKEQFSSVFCTSRSVSLCRIHCQPRNFFSWKCKFIQNKRTHRVKRLPCCALEDCRALWKCTCSKRHYMTLNINFSVRQAGTASVQGGSEQKAAQSSPFLCVVDARKMLRNFFTADGQMKGREGEGKRRVQWNKNWSGNATDTIF